MHFWGDLHFVAWYNTTMNVSCHAYYCLHNEKHYPLTILTSTIWFSCMFTTWKNSIIHFCFKYLFISDIILPDCHSASLSQNKIMGYWQKNSYSTSNIHFCCCVKKKRRKKQALLSNWPSHLFFNNFHIRINLILC